MSIFIFEKCQEYILQHIIFNIFYYWTIKIHMSFIALGMNIIK